MKTKFRSVRTHGTLSVGLFSTALMTLLLGCDHVTQANVDENHGARAQVTSPGSQKSESEKVVSEEPVTVVDNKYKTKRISISTALEKISNLELVELFDSSGKKVVGLSTESGIAILRLVSKSVIVNSDEVEEEGFPAMPSFRMQFSFEDPLRLDLSFFDDHTVWIFADCGGGQRDISDDVNKLNSLLQDLPIHLAESTDDSIEVSDILRVELHLKQEEGDGWRDVDLRAGKEIMQLVLNSTNIEVFDETSIVKSEMQSMNFNLRFMIGKSSFLYAEIFEDFTWIRYGGDICAKRDTSAQFKKLTKLIADGETKGSHLNN